MPWTLEIHHIGLIMDGDATLIIARQVPPAPAPAVNVRSLLIDGGKNWTWSLVSNYIGGQLAGGAIDAIVCTHYDPAHMNGLSCLLRQPGICTNTVIYDQGWEQGPVYAPYIDYVRAVNGLNIAGQPIPGVAHNRTRLTWMVQSDPGIPGLVLPPGMGAPAVPPNLAAVNQPPHWLLTANPLLDPLWHDPANPAAGAPGGAPTVRFIAANGYVRNPPGAAPPISGPFLTVGALVPQRQNEKSLAVEVTFGNFRYYAGGDLENLQETRLLPLLNNANNVAGRVLAMKASNHGAAISTSQPFVAQIRPEVAFVSCGSANTQGDPAMQTLNVLDGYPAAGVAHAPAPPPAPNLPVPFYLSGFQTIVPLQPYFGDMARTAGDPAAVPVVIPGHAVLTVSAAQSLAPVNGRLYHNVEVAIRTALTAPGLGGALAAGPAAPIALAAAAAALDHGPGPAAASVITQVAGPFWAPAANAASAAANAAFFPAFPAIGMAQTVTTAAIAAGEAPAVAAAAGAAAGTYFEGGTLLAAFHATRSALVTAGLANNVAVGIVAGMHLQTPVQFEVRYWEQQQPQPGFVTSTFS